MTRLTIGNRHRRPIRWARFSSLGFTATAVSPSMVSGRVVATVTNSPVSRPLSSTKWVFQVPEVAVDLAHLDLVVGQGGLGGGVPIHEAFAAVDQPVFEQPEERLAHGFGADVVHGEPLAVPVARAAHGLELVGDALLVFILPRLDLFDERLAAGLTFGFELFVVFEGGFALGLGGACRPRSGWQCRRGRCRGSRRCCRRASGGNGSARLGACC